MIHDKKGILRRKKICSSILNNQTNDFSQLAQIPSYQRELRSLRILMIDQFGQPNTDDHWAIVDTNLFSDKAQPWQVEEEKLSIIVPFPINLAQLWVLEAYLEPHCQTGRSMIYSIELEKIHNNHSKKNIEQLIKILQTGLCNIFSVK
jgi:hypothetical protein